MSVGFNTSSRFYTPNEFGKFLSISKTTVYRLIDTRKIPFYKIKGSIRFAEQDVLNFLKENRIEPIN